MTNQQEVLFHETDTGSILALSTGLKRVKFGLTVFRACD